MDSRCSECGEIGRLNAAGVCAYRGACDHRVLRHEAEMGRLYAEMARLDPLPCGHTRADHQTHWEALILDDPVRGVVNRYPAGDLDRFLRSLREGYSPDDNEG